MPLLPNRWAVLRLRSSGPRIEWRYSDSLRRVRQLSWDAKEFAARQVWPPPPGSHSFSEFTGLIRDLAEGMPSERWGAGTGSVPVAVFIELPPEVSFGDLQRRSTFGSELDPQALQFVQLPRTRRFRRSPFELPLNVFAVGPESPRALTELEKSSWYAYPAVQEFGLRIQTSEQSSSSKLKEAQSDILLADASSPVLSYLHRLPAARRPRLLVALDQHFNEPFRLQAPPGVAVLRLPDVRAGQDVERYLRAFTYGILHDSPLHGALRSASLEVHPQFEPLLIADPASNQSLRMEDALTGIKRQTERLEATLPELDFDPLLRRVAQASDPEWQDRLPDLRRRIFDLSGGKERKQISEARSLLSNAKSLPFYFAHESDSVVPMASTRAEFAEVTKNETIQEAVEKIVADDNVVALLKSHQQRFVDLALARLETEPLMQSLTRSDTLETGKNYQLRVHVGNRLADSIVTGPDVPVDPILPAADAKGGHQLEIAVQGKNFEVISKPVQTAWLPQFGATEPVYFQIRAPKDSGTKYLRVCLYCRNYLIQSYRFTAEVTATESPVNREGKERLGATLEFSRTEHFSDLGEFQPRVLSVGVNRGNSSTHEVIVKSENNTSAEITLFPTTFEPEVEKFRKILETASLDPANRKLTRVYPEVPPGSHPGDDVAQIFRELAKQGRWLYESVFGKVVDTPLRPAFVDVAQGFDKKLQVIRFDDNFVFPWVILYDFPLPGGVVGGPAPPVCLGVTPDAGGKPVQCSHTADTPAYCVRGFWGVRHYVEEMIGKGTNTKPNIAKTEKNAVRIVADATLSPSTTLITNLNASLGSAQVADGPLDPDKLLDLLWANPPERPSILIVLGHLAKTPIRGEPDDSRIVLVPNSKWLLRQKIADRYTKDPVGWRQPRSIVLLMACESAATEVATVNDFVTAWNAAGAGAIVGTECVVGADLAASLAESVTTELWNGKTLGEAMTNFRRRAVTHGNPLGLVFHAVGDVDLTVN